MKQLEVQIMGQSYLLGCPEGDEARFQQAVQRVDEAMCRIRDAGKVKARDRIAVLAALNLAFDLNAPNAAAASHAAVTAVDAAALSAASGANSSDNAQLAALTARLDDALLGEDGRLL